MTVDEKRKALSQYCRNSCLKCVLGNKDVCNCGKGHYFTVKKGDYGYMTDAEIIGAYELVFGPTETIKTVTSESTITLESAVPDNSITISGVDKISNISIYFKERE